jgi:hypothetical protein
MIRVMISDKYGLAISGVIALACAAAMGAASVPARSGEAVLKSSTLIFPSLGGAPSAAGAPSVFVPDKGKFRITIGGQQLGTEEFEISLSSEAWIERSSVSAHGPDGSAIKATGQLRLAPDGSPVHYEWSAEAKKKAGGTVDFSGGVAKCVGDFGAPLPMRKDFTFTSPHVAVLDNNLYYQYAILARLYDWKTGGAQSFPVLIPQDMVPGTISVESLGPQQSGGEKYEALRASTPDLEILLYLDGSHRLMRIEVPSSSAVIERE